MGLITGMMSLLFGDGRNAVTETVGAFREHADKAGARRTRLQTAALAQYASEFQHQRRGLFDRLIDGINRLPRPMLALGTIALFVAAMWHPEWFADRMVGVALIPEPLWWLMGAVVSFYFGARHQAKGQEFQRSVVETVAMSQALRETDPQPGTAERPRLSPPPQPLALSGTPDVSDNAALAEWWAQNG